MNNQEELNIEELKKQKLVLEEIEKVKEKNKKRSLDIAYIGIGEILKDNPETKKQIDNIILNQGE